MTKPVALAVFATAALTGDSVVEGNPESPVRVIAYEDLQCGDCAVYRRLLDQHLLPKYGNRVAFEHRDFPLPKHKWARHSAVAARHFDALDGALGIRFRRWAFSNIPLLTAGNFGDHLRAWAKANGQDPDAASAALDNAALAKRVEDDYQEGIARGIARTPTVLVHGKPFVEPSDPEELSKAIDAALAATEPRQ